MIGHVEDQVLTHDRKADEAEVAAALEDVSVPSRINIQTRVLLDAAF
jgi:hypothetical protein